MSLTLFILFVSAGSCVLCIIALIKSHINFTIRMRWIDEIFSDSNHNAMLCKFNSITYQKTFLDFTLWKHIPFKDYLNKLEQSK